MSDFFLKARPRSSPSASYANRSERASFKRLLAEIFHVLLQFACVAAPLLANMHRDPEEGLEGGIQRLEGGIQRPVLVECGNSNAQIVALSDEKVLLQDVGHALGKLQL